MLLQMSRQLLIVTFSRNLQTPSASDPIQNPRNNYIPPAATTEKAFPIKINKVWLRENEAKHMNETDPSFKSVGSVADVHRALLPTGASSNEYPKHWE